MSNIVNLAEYRMKRELAADYGVKTLAQWRSFGELIAETEYRRFDEKRKEEKKNGQKN